MSDRKAIFITGGVHSTELGVPQAQGVPPPPERLVALLDEFAANFYRRLAEFLSKCMVGCRKHAMR